MYIGQCRLLLCTFKREKKTNIGINNIQKYKIYTTLPYISKPLIVHYYTTNVCIHKLGADQFIYFYLGRSNYFFDFSQNS